VAGHSNKEIAATLFLTVSTVESALWKIYRKLDVRSRTELVATPTPHRAQTLKRVNRPNRGKQDH